MLRNPKCLDSLDFGSDLSATETEAIVLAHSVVTSVGGNITETKLVASLQPLPTAHQPIVTHQSKHEDLSPSRLHTKMHASSNTVCNMANESAIIRKVIFAKMEELVALAQQLEADPELAKRELEELSSTMSLTSGTTLNKTEVLVDSLNKKNAGWFLQTF